MAQVTIDEVIGSEAYTLADGTEMVGYQVRFSGDAGAGVAQYSKKPTSDPPEPGESFDGTIVHRGDKATLKRVWQRAGDASGTASPGRTWKPRDPKETKAIQHQHSQKVAIVYMQTLAAAGRLPSDFSLDDVFKVADRVRENVEEVASR